MTQGVEKIFWPDGPLIPVRIQSVNNHLTNPTSDVPKLPKGWSMLGSAGKASDKSSPQDVVQNDVRHASDQILICYRQIWENFSRISKKSLYSVYKLISKKRPKTLAHKMIYLDRSLHVPWNRRAAQDSSFFQFHFCCFLSFRKLIFWRFPY